MYTCFQAKFFSHPANFVHQVSDVFNKLPPSCSLPIQSSKLNRLSHTTFNSISMITSGGKIVWNKLTWCVIPPGKIPSNNQQHSTKFTNLMDINHSVCSIDWILKRYQFLHKLTNRKQDVFTVYRNNTGLVIYSQRNNVWPCRNLKISRDYLCALSTITH